MLFTVSVSQQSACICACYDGKMSRGTRWRRLVVKTYAAKDTACNMRAGIARKVE